jgi:hypothetical protein
MLEQVVTIRGTLAADHPDQLASQHALAMVYQANGQVKEAAELLEQVVKIRGTTLAADRPDQLAWQLAPQTTPPNQRLHSNGRHHDRRSIRNN